MNVDQPGNDILDFLSLCDKLDVMGSPIEEVLMSRIHTRFKASGLSLNDPGLKRGSREESARKSAWQFLKKTDDPRLSILNRFAQALEISLAELISNPERKRNGHTEKIGPNYRLAHASYLFRRIREHRL